MPSAIIATLNAYVEAVVFFTAAENWSVALGALVGDAATDDDEAGDVSDPPLSPQAATRANEATATTPRTTLFAIFTLIVPP
ncbi:hypothetical protein GCM10010199_29720 [Dactylosporangium roseum]